MLPVIIKSTKCGSLPASSRQTAFRIF